VTLNVTVARECSLCESVLQSVCLFPKLGESAEPVVAMFATRFAMRGAPLAKVGIVCNADEQDCISSYIIRKTYSKNKKLPVCRVCRL